MQDKDGLDRHRHLEEGLRAAFGEPAGGPARRRALARLRTDLEDVVPRLPASAVAVVGTLRRWLQDPELASVRDAEDLPEDWSTLWSAVDALLRQHADVAEEL